MTQERKQQLIRDRLVRQIPQLLDDIESNANALDLDVDVLRMVIEPWMGDPAVDPDDLETVRDELEDLVAHIQNVPAEIEAEAEAIVKTVRQCIAFAADEAAYQREMTA